MHVCVVAPGVVAPLSLVLSLFVTMFVMLDLTIVVDTFWMVGAKFIVCYFRSEFIV
jgi:hypothetical protein